MGDAITRSNNTEIDVANVGTDITYQFASSGIDTAILKYYNLEGPAVSLSIRPDKIVSILSINGVTLTDPITVGTNGFSSKKDLNPGLEIRTMVIRTTTATTNIKVFAY